MGIVGYLKTILFGGHWMPQSIGQKARPTAHNTTKTLVPSEARPNRRIDREARRMLVNQLSKPKFTVRSPLHNVHHAVPGAKVKIKQGTDLIAKKAQDLLKQRPVRAHHIRVTGERNSLTSMPA